MLNITRLAMSLFLFTNLGSFSSMALTDEQSREFARNAIQDCRAKIYKVEKVSRVLGAPQKCGWFSMLPRDKCKRIQRVQRAFNEMYLDLLLSDMAAKASIGLAQTADERENLTKDYSSNCSRFSEGLLDLARYASGGITNSSQQKIFENLIKQNSNKSYLRRAK